VSDLSDLYQEVILDHNRRPRNWGALADATRVAHGHNPLCGDRLTLHVKIDGDRLTGVSFEGSGCAISKASASLMTDAVKGRTLAETLDLFDRVHIMLTTPGGRAGRRSVGGEAGGARRCSRVPDARQMRVTCLAHPEVRDYEPR
jgi:nitrogen fixation NifU-like protein